MRLSTPDSTGGEAHAAIAEPAYGVDRDRRVVSLGRPISFGASGIGKRLGAFDRIAPLGGTRLLDVGCGNGAYTIELAKRFEQVDAIDVEPDRLEAFASVMPADGRRITISQMAAETLDFLDDAFDAVTAIEVLEHVVDLNRSLREITRVLRPGGLVYIAAPNQLFPLETHSIVVPGTGREVPGRYVPFLPYLSPLHRRVARARTFTDRSLTLALAGVGLERVGIGHVMPPFDHWQFGRRFIRPLTERLERSAFGIFGVSIIAVFRRPEG